MATDISAVQRLLSRYVGQLVHGCGSPECREPMCDTGRRNASVNRPVRRYTPRSARAIALALAGAPSPRKHLCVYYTPSVTGSGSGRDGNESSEGPRDPSSFEQLLSDTPTIRSICDPGAAISIKPTEFERIYHSLDPLLQTSLLGGRVPNSFANNEQAASILCHALRFCLDNVPRGTTSQFIYVDTWIRDGSAYPTVNLTVPTDGKWNIWLEILDSYERSQPLLSTICHVIALRTDLEVRLQQLQRALCGGDDGALERRLLPTLLRHNNLDSAATISLIIWLKKTFMLHWNGKPSTPRSSIATGTLLFIQQIEESLGIYLPGPTKWFALPAIADRLDVVETAESWIRNAQVGQHTQDGSAAAASGMSEPQGGQEPGLSDRQGLEDTPASSHLLSFGFLFEAAQRTLYFRALNHLKMREVHSKAEKAVALRRRVAPQTDESKPDERFKYAEEHYLLLNVSRTKVIRDAYDQLWQRRSEELRRPLRVRLGEVEELEIGHDLGGVQIEFFNLICKEAFAEDAGLFTTDTTTGLSYFRVGSLQPLYMFELLGLLFALAIYNGITLPVSFPKVFYKLLLGGHNIDIALIEIADAWPEEARSLRYIEETPGAEEDFDFSFPLEANGIRMFVLGPVEDPIEDQPVVVLVAKAITTTYPSAEVDVGGLRWPGFRFLMLNSAGVPSVTAGDKAQYVAAYVHWLAYSSVAPQLEAFQRGLYHLVDKHSLSMFITPENVKAFVEGSMHLDIEALRRVTRYDGYDAQSKYIASFWRVVKSWPEEKQKQLLKFVTAAERVPLGGPGHLIFVIQYAQSVSAEHLPTTSTCFGTLQLPRYPTIKTLDEKLSLAIQYGLEGFGTG